MGNNLEVQCCCCQIKFGSGSSKSKKLNEKSSLLSTPNQHAQNAAMADNFNPNPTIDITQFQNPNNAYYLNQNNPNLNQNPYQQNQLQYPQAIHDLRHPPPLSDPQNSVIFHSDAGSSRGNSRNGSPRHSNHSQINMNMNKPITRINNHPHLQQSSSYISSEYDSNRRRTTVADPFSNDDDEDDDSDILSPKNISSKSHIKSNQIKSQINSNIKNENNQILPNQKRKSEINVNNNNNNNVSNPTTTSSEDLDSDEENVLSATDVDEEEQMLHNQSSAQNSKENSQKGHSRGPSFDSDNFEKPSLLGTSRASKTVPIHGGKLVQPNSSNPDTGSASDSDGDPAALLRAKTHSNWTEQKLEELEEEMTEQFKMLEHLHKQSSLHNRSGFGSVHSMHSGMQPMPQMQPMQPMQPMQQMQQIPTHMGSMSGMTGIVNVNNMGQTSHVFTGSGDGSTGQTGGDNTTDWHDDGDTEFSQDDEMEQMKKRMEEMANQNAYGGM